MGPSPRSRGSAGMTSRIDRIAKNQAMFRVFNERMTAWPERRAAPPTDKLVFYCECADERCYAHVGLTGDEYEAIRLDSTCFVVTPGHVFPEAERVVAAPDGFDVVEKNEELRGLLERIDPRKGGPS